MIARTDRRHEVSTDDQRSKFQRDRDRILYSSAFRRLAGITQIVRAGEAEVFHTRQQHTLKVAQVGRRLSELLLNKQPSEAAALGVNAEVVEAAALAHDLGHPPFGHMGEKTLHKLVTEHGDDDGYEGNAQTFRIVTNLAVRFNNCPGLDLSRATLAACLKYPWHREPENPARTDKWGAYRIDEVDFAFARALFQHSNRSTEAELMDWSDDIAYSVHDLEDFHRCGVIPWRRILNGDHTELLITRAQKAWFGAPPDAAGRLRRAMSRLDDFFERRVFKALFEEAYEGSRDQRQQLRLMTSRLIGRYIRAANLRVPDGPHDDRPIVIIGDNELDEVKLLKQITRDYVISNPTLLAQQEGQKRVVVSLYNTIFDSTTASGPPAWLPRRLEYLWSRDVSTARFVADCIASLTEAEVIGLNARLQGVSGGSVLDPIVR